MMRIGLFLLTNLAVLVLASVTLNILGVGSIMAQNGVDLDLQRLLVFCAVFGMAGSVISLLMSKWLAKRSTGTRLITEPSGEGERWLVQNVRYAQGNSLSANLQAYIAEGARVCGAP